MIRERKESMTEQEFQKLQVGDSVRLHSDKVGYIQWFGRFNGKRWVKSARKRANGVWLWFPQDGMDGYVSRQLIKGHVAAPLLTEQEALLLRWET